MTETRRIAGYCTLCRSRCGAITEVAGNRVVAVQPLPGHPTGGALCAKGRALPEMIHAPGRLTTPLRRRSPKGVTPVEWEPIHWDAALDEIAARLGAIREADGAEAVAFAMTTPSGTPMVDSSEWVERLVRCFGSPNLIYAVEVCGWHKDYAHELTFGRGVGFPDYARAEVIVLWGHNPARTWLAQASRIAEARARGAKVVVIDPKPDGSGQQADHWLRVRPGADGAVAMGAIRHLIETGTYDAGFVRRWTNAPLLVDIATGRLLTATDAGLAAPGGSAGSLVALDADGRPVAVDPRDPATETARAAAGWQIDATAEIATPRGPIAVATVLHLLRKSSAAYTPEHVAELSWIPAPELRAFYTLLEDAPRLAYHSWTGVGQHTNATAIERAIATLYALTGACDAPGGNVWPVPPPTRAVNALSLLPEGQREKALGLDTLPLGPPARGWITLRDFARAVTEGQPYPVRALVSFGTNMVASQADGARTLAALRALDFHVHADMVLNPTADCADIVLPVNMPPEREALKIGFEIDQAAAETLHYRPQMIDGPPGARPDYRIAFDLARRLGHGAQFFDGSLHDGWNWQLAPLGLTVDDLRTHPEGLRLRQPFSHRKYLAPTEDGRLRGFPTGSGLVEIYSEQLHAIGQPPLPEHVEPEQSPYRSGEDGPHGGTDAASNRGTNGNASRAFPLVLTTAKSGWYVHSSHRQVGSLRRKSPDPAVEICSALARVRGLRDGDWAVVATPGGEATLRVRLNEALDPRIAVAEFGWWQGSVQLNRAATPVAGPGTANVNAILSDASRDPVSGSVPLRAVMCELRPHPTANIGRWAGTRDFRIAAMRAETAETVALDLVPMDGGPLPEFLPGQHVTVTAAEGGPARSYSLTGPGMPAPHLSIAVRRQGTEEDARAGRSLSAAIHRMAAGDLLRLEAPAGHFTPPADSPRPLVFLAAGIGITPFLGVLERMAAEARDTEVLLLHGCRSGAEHPFAARLAELGAALPGLTRITHYSAPLATDRAGRDFDLPGRIDIAAVAHLHDRHPLVYICGGPGFTEDARAAMRAQGVPAFDILSEAFVSPPEVPATLAPQTVRIAGSDASFDWSPEMGSLLDAARAQGVALPAGCRVGQCESCVCRILAGRVAHLTPNDMGEDLCVTCQAVPLSDVTLAI
ncbi:molybdopterin-dependent oxidoreductase [Acidimangrovimonas sediminis]|uniref:molybdopterin-dependent oxidoreductase n=1 Tax=Acidimangrovimonas sediminis TaxID=2056283 RepID=UPI000C80A255|nr:molybdopterin-dependent oxidoreductase [Acidimangrovimonas sediminis]